MKFFLRGLLALGFSIAISLTAAAADKAVPAGSASCGCTADAGAGPANRVLRGKIGRRIGGIGDNLGGRVDSVAESYIGANQRISAFFTRLGGPRVDVAATPGIGQKDKGGPYTQPGTVVFPQHPFARSPRDFFMTEQP